MLERARYVHPECSDRWLARFLNRRLTLADDHSQRQTVLHDGGFRVAECVRGYEELLREPPVAAFSVRHE